MGERNLAASGRRWAVASPHRAATEAAAEIFGAGGNAIDAAVTAAVTLAVVYPHMCGVGGDLFALVQETNGQAIAINSSGAAPIGIDPDAIRAEHREMPERGPLPITVPGAVAGWSTLLREGGSIPWERSFERAIAFARDGVTAVASLRRTLVEHATLFASDPGMREVLFHGGEPLAEGNVLRQPALAATLEAVATGGPDVLYGGEIGEAYAAGLRRSGSPISIEDLRRHEPEIVAPLSGRYRDLDVSVVPPNSQGFVLLEMLAAIERLGIDPDPFGPDAVLLARVFRTASADRDRHNADPRVEHVPFASLLDDGHIAALAGAARDQRQVAAASGRAPTGDTIAIVTADGDGRAVSLIQSLSNGFGSGILEPSTGIVAHNRGGCFTLDATSRNRIEGGKRPAHTLMPVLVRRGARVVAVPGTMGGYAQPQINATSIIRSFDLRMAPDEALATPRWLVNGMDQERGDPFVVAESTVPRSTLEDLRSDGFRIDEFPDRTDEVGHPQLILVRDDGEMSAATDPRADGSAEAG
jgi:gamma-glutamyltranspeptidase/glutathione hydrolase